MADSLTVYRHNFEINENNIAKDDPANGFENAMRFVVALLSEVQLVPDSDVVESRDPEHVGNSNRQSSLTAATYKSVEDGE